MSKHTPGPWEVQRDSHLRFYITQPSDTPDRVAGFYAEVRRFTPDIDQVKANAHLIAVAPDLLEALQSAVDWIEDDRFDDDYIGEQWYHDARAAIAKAKGETE